MLPTRVHVQPFTLLCHRVMYLTVSIVSLLAVSTYCVSVKAAHHGTIVTGLGHQIMHAPMITSGSAFSMGSTDRNHTNHAIKLCSSYARGEGFEWLVQ